MHLEFPQMFLGTLPAMMAWAGLWWAQYPVDHSLREQNVLENLNDDLPVHAPPSFLQTANANFRLQIGFTLLPVVVILLMRDVTIAALAITGVQGAGGIENYIMPPAALAVFLFAPELLRRVLHTERLADSPLRRRLEAMCHQAKLGYRDILLWRTGGTMGNAAVMGLFSRVRYVLLSDLLLETMTDQQIEAVFAHELGHVVHKHLWWLGTFAVIAMLFISGPGTLLMQHAEHWYVTLHHHSQDSWDTIAGLFGAVLFFGLFVLAFGYLSPRFERQADVYAARTMQKEAVARPHVDGSVAVATETTDTSVPAIVYYNKPSHVGEYGAGVFAAALHRVAIINHMPVTARNWSHGSIAQRMRALHEMSADPAHTTRFDKTMSRLYVGIILCLFVLGMWTAVQVTRESPPASVGNVGSSQR
jgi:STE24 endopeptidase